MMAVPECKVAKPLKVGGTVDSKKNAYVERPTDDELLGLLERGEYCNVLCPRQMGTSSLLARTGARLRERGVRVARLDMAGGLGAPAEADQWYRGLMQEVARLLELPVDVSAWWQARTAATPNQRLLEFFREQVATEGTRTVIVCDEIDSTLKLPYTDDFFVALRSMYNDRDQEPAYARLTFCLVGVATPNELIKDRRTTPYNVGQTLELLDFDAERDDLSPLYEAMGAEDEAQGKALVKEVLRWTGGQPYLTVKLCNELLRQDVRSPGEVARCVERMFPELEMVKADAHFGSILNFLEERVEDQAAALELYRRVWSGRKEPDSLAPAPVRLKLVGLLKRDRRGLLVVRNAIYHRIFTAAWASAALPVEMRQVQAARSPRRLAAVAAALLLLSPVAWYELVYPRELKETLGQAQDDYGLAQDAYRKPRAVPFDAATADEQRARFFERMALRAEQEEKRDEALLWRLKALEAHPDDIRRRAAGQLVAADLGRLLFTFPLGDATKWEALSILDAVPQLVSFSPDGRRVVTGSADGTARVWSAETGEPVGAPLRHASLVRAVSFSPDSRRVVTGSADGTARVWSAETGEPVGAPLKHAGWVLAVSFSPDGRRVVTGSDDGTARVWSAETGEPVSAPLKHAKWVLAVSFSPDGQSVLTAAARWVHVVRLEDQGMTGTASYLLPEPMLLLQGGFRFLDAAGTRVQVVAGIENDKLHLLTLAPELSHAEPLQGNPAELLSTWQRKLNLRIDESGKVVPLHP